MLKKCQKKFLWFFSRYKVISQSMIVGGDRFFNPAYCTFIVRIEMSVLSMSVRVSALPRLLVSDCCSGKSVVRTVSSNIVWWTRLALRQCNYKSMNRQQSQTIKLYYVFVVGTGLRYLSVSGDGWSPGPSIMVSWTRAWDSSRSWSPSQSGSGSSGPSS